jgi:hypothetical protein
MKIFLIFAAALLSSSLAFGLAGGLGGPTSFKDNSRAHVYEVVEILKEIGNGVFEVRVKDQTSGNILNVLATMADLEEISPGVFILKTAANPRDT